MDDDWDLQAVVRSCCATTTTSSIARTTTATTTTATSTCATDFYSLFRFRPPQESNLLYFQNLIDPLINDMSPLQELCDIYNYDKPLFNKPSPQSSLSPETMPASPLYVLAASSDQQRQLQTQLQSKQLPSSSAPKTKSGHSSSSTTQSPRSKRRKKQMKRVCQVPAEGLSSDMWSWRKYGQKPIKGSPYPRGYYRCSTSKGCLARKQVERNRSDPTMFIVTYTAEHNHPMPTHRNSVAGSTRLKPTTSSDFNKPTSPPHGSADDSLSPAPATLDSSTREEKDDIIEDDEDDIGASDLPLEDDFLAGLDDELVGPGPTNSDCFFDHFPVNGQFPWLFNNATTTIAGGS